MVRLDAGMGPVLRLLISFWRSLYFPMSTENSACWTETGRAWVVEVCAAFSEVGRFNRYSGSAINCWNALTM